MKKSYLYFTLIAMMFVSQSACSEKSPRNAKYTKNTIDSTKLCPDAYYHCLSETQNDIQKRKLLETQFTFNGRGLLWIRLNVIEKTFDYYKVDKGVDEMGKDAFDQLRYRVLRDPKTDAQYQALPDKGNKKMAELALKIAADFMNKTEEELVMDKYYQMTEREERDIKLRKKQRSYHEISQMMGLFFPGFWKDTPEEEQIKWVMRTEKLAQRYEPDTDEISEDMAIICGIIGLDFETKREHSPIVHYLSSMKENSHGQMSDTADYLQFIYLERDYNFSGDHLNSWSMRDALSNLPEPERHVPRFSEEVPNKQMHVEKHDIWKIYKETILHEEVR